MSCGRRKFSYGKHLQILMQGPEICLSLTGKAREAALELSVENSDTGVVQLLAKLDNFISRTRIS